MGTVPPRIIPPMGKFHAGVVSLNEVRTKMDLPPLNQDKSCYFNDATNKPIYTDWQQLASIYVDDGQGGLISTEGLTPIYTVGKPEPTGYIDHRNHRMWRIDQDEPRSGQYEDAMVDYGEC